MMESIKHQPDQHCFIAEVNGSLAKLEYDLKDQSVTFTSTYVPFRLRGKGYAEKLVDTGLSWARQQGYAISSTCWYVDKFLTPQMAG
ncbi:GNAT family N-acetyltransferase [Pseudomaricurvus sp.]|uniref:GNAT family N-acetyltransferase n=1 Tax=Pseudomaricurvus sp. TaxID=2004510 RepID=UPI003F6B5E5B